MIANDFKNVSDNIEEEISRNNKIFWKLLSVKKRKNGIPTVIRHDDRVANIKKACNLFAKHFKSVFIKLGKIKTRSHGRSGKVNETTILNYG